jgi:arabinogalactan endo-1,4-beta-galactosidase
MSNVQKFVEISQLAGKDVLNVLKTKGVSTVRYELTLVNDIVNAPIAADLIKFAESVGSMPDFDWNLKINTSSFLMNVLGETGPDQRMFLRKSERGFFQNVHDLFDKLASVNGAPKYVELDTEMFDAVTSIKFSFEEQTRMINAIINGAKSVNAQCKIILSTSKCADNEAAKKWFNRFQVSGGKPFDVISIKYGMDAEQLYDLSLNMGDLSRRFEAEIIIDVKEVADVSKADISFDDVSSAVSVVSLDRGLAVNYAETVFNRVMNVA